MKYPSFSLPVHAAKSSLVAAAVVLAIANPVGAVTPTLSAQQALDQFKSKVTTAINDSITKLQDSAGSLNYSVSVTADSSGISASASSNNASASASASSNGVSGSVNTSNGGSASIDAGSGSLSANAKSASGGALSVNASDGSATISFQSGGTLQSALSIPKDLKSKLQAANQKAVDKLNDLKQEVQATASLDDLKEKAKQFDQEFKDIATATIQATVTKAIDSQTQVLDRLQVAENNLQTQITQLKECIQSVSVNASGSVGGGNGASGSVNASAPGCTNLNVDANSGDQGQSLQDALDEIKSSMQTIRSFLSSSISLVSQLKDGNYSGTIKSFSGISAQIDIVVTLSSQVQNDLVNLTAAVNK